MKTVVIRELGDYELESIYELDLTRNHIKDCCGCWSCWLKTPGRCINKDLDQFYFKYLEADKVVIFSKLTKGFVSGNLKSLFDRMIPLFLPQIELSIRESTGQFRHMVRYEKYPDIEFYYEGNFVTKEGNQIFEDYIYRTFDQFASKNITVKTLEQYGQ
ncbi:flavodoxin family protein [Clostridium sp. MSJ-11]|uniref:Flavodoxin family protein n=1 Tax=Clostridium mobile TaxID=2841512 RepID=A0ABS6EGY9_9CLOT|nr:flavodoxin family protein [Clostridium mobile]MBU5484478.1 flavodoxin family protein [Clostridium mobile]